jgi:hypothetical protein
MPVEEGFGPGRQPKRRMTQTVTRRFPPPPRQMPQMRLSRVPKNSVIPEGYGVPGLAPRGPVFPGSPAIRSPKALYAPAREDEFPPWVPPWLKDAITSVRRGFETGVPRAINTLGDVGQQALSGAPEQLSGAGREGATRISQAFYDLMDRYINSR